MTICFLSSMHPPLDKRVHYKEAVLLAKEGYRVVHIAPGEVDKDVCDGVEIITFAGKRGLVGRVGQLSTLYRLARKVKADCYHCNEVESWLVGVLLKLSTKAQVVFDVHEIYSHDLAESRFPKFLHPMIIGSVRAFYKLLLPFTDRLVLAKRSTAEEFGNTKVPLVLARNFVEISGGDMLEKESIQPKIKSDASIRVIHLGAINKTRGWPQMLEAINLCQNKNIVLHIVGKFGDSSQAEFEQQVRDMGLQSRVIFDSWVPYNEVQDVLRSSDIGIIMFQPVLHSFTHALPHKLFDYMLAGLPVIVPDFAVEVSEIVSEAECGLLLDVTKPRVVADALDWLAEDVESRRQLGEKGRAAVLDHFNWEQEGKLLLKMYQGLSVRVGE